MNAPSSIHQLLKAYTENRANPEVVEALRRLSEQEGMEESFRQALAQMLEQQEKDAPAMDEQHYEQLFRTIISVDKPLRQQEEFVQEDKGRVVFLRSNRWWWAAAAILIMAMGVTLWMRSMPDKPNNLVIDQQVPDVAPGRAGAILTLADGSKVVLDSLKDGVIAKQSGSNVVLENGQLTYNKENEKVSSITYNTMATPKGRQFQVLLPDGTKVWLNAASSLTYPTVFAGAERKVEIIGEAYFEVAENKKIPFVVVANHGMEIQVLGTHFNINAYEEEALVRTSLLSGSIQATNLSTGALKNDRIVLKPGEQVQLNTTGSLKVVQGVDMTKVMAWKNGLFNFEGLHLREAMRQLARWYDIEVVYEKDVPDIVFGGKMQMDITLSQLLKVLQDAEVNFRLEADNKLVIIKK